jgi:hypothetical protein
MVATTLPFREAVCMNGTDTASPQFGPRLLQHFLFDPSFRNLNHGEPALIIP